MYQSAKYLEGIDEAITATLCEAARDQCPVAGLTHTFYRYPARFSPVFVREAIRAFTRRGQLVLDPFMGGGTTLVEAMALGRFAVGSDVSSLAEFVSKVKTQAYLHDEIATFQNWAEIAAASINMHSYAVYPSDWIEAGYLRNLSGKRVWRVRKAIQQLLESTRYLGSERLELLGRCLVLKTSQWALDARKKIPTIAEFRARFLWGAGEIAEGAYAFSAEVQSAFGDHPQSAICLHGPASALAENPIMRLSVPPRLILTSPPYPGVHILYHRWQVDGRKETPAPFWIANKLDGAGSKFYTMGDRKEAELRSYYDGVRASFDSLRRLCGPETLVVQVLAFSDPSWQLPRYLDVMNEAGFSENVLPGIEDAPDGRLWRCVPNRRWHADQMGQTSGSKEVVLFHVPKLAMRQRQRYPMQPLPHLQVRQRSRSWAPETEPKHL